MSDTENVSFEDEAQPEAAPVSEETTSEDAPVAEEAPAAEEAPSEELAEEEAGEEVEEELDPIEAFRRQLRSMPGDWYVIHSYAGYENKVKTNLLTRAQSMNMEEYIYQVEVPIETVKEVKNGVLKEVKRNKYPGYVLVRMDLTDESWGTVRHTPGVTGFVGQGHNPSPLTLTEVERMLAPEPEKKPAAAAAGTTSAPGSLEPTPAAPIEVDFSVGDSVKIVSGAFATLDANISEINAVSQRVTVLVEIFGRETPVDLGFADIRKN